jgi:hypothetical protein
VTPECSPRLIRMLFTQDPARGVARLERVPLDPAR